MSIGQNRAGDRLHNVLVRRTVTAENVHVELGCLTHALAMSRAACRHDTTGGREPEGRRQPAAGRRLHRLLGDWIDTYKNVYTGPCVRSRSLGLARPLKTSARSRMTLAGPPGTNSDGCSKGWSPAIGSPWLPWARASWKSECTRALNIASSTWRSSRKASTCFTPLRSEPVGHRNPRSTSRASALRT